jgi:hypothetical protein
MQKTSSIFIKLGAVGLLFFLLLSSCRSSEEVLNIELSCTGIVSDSMGIKGVFHQELQDGETQQETVYIIGRTDPKSGLTWWRTSFQNHNFFSDNDPEFISNVNHSHEEKNALFVSKDFISGKSELLESGSPASKREHHSLVINRVTGEFTYNSNVEHNQIALLYQQTGLCEKISRKF